MKIHRMTSLAAVLALGACGDGRHFDAPEGEGGVEVGAGAGGSTLDPASLASGAGDQAAAVPGGALQLGNVWGEGLAVEVSGLRWAAEGEIELLVGAVDEATGRPLDGLDERSFSFFEDGQDLGSEVLFEVQQEENLQVALVLDLSRSMLAAEAVEPLQGAAHALLDALPPGTEVALVQFATSHDLVQGFTSDMGQLTRAVEDLAPAPDRAGQFTNLWGSLAYAGSLFGEAAPGEGRVVVAFTDGRDNVAESDVDGARSALMESGALVYAVGLGSELDQDGLRLLASDSRFVETTEPAELRPIFNDIGQRLGRLVRLRYTTPKLHGHHTLKVSIISSSGAERAGFELAFSLE